MIATLHDVNSLIGVAAFNSLVIVLCAVTLCFVVRFLLAIAGVRWEAGGERGEAGVTAQGYTPRESEASCNNSVNTK